MVKKRTLYKLKEKGTPWKYLYKRETLVKMKIDKDYDNWDIVKNQIEQGHSEIMDAYMRKCVKNKAIDIDENKALRLNPVIEVDIDLYREGQPDTNFKIVAGKTLGGGNWLNLKEHELDKSIQDQIDEINDFIDDLYDKYIDLVIAISGGNINYRFYYES